MALAEILLSYGAPMTPVLGMPLWDQSPGFAGAGAGGMPSFPLLAKRDQAVNQSPTLPVLVNVYQVFPAGFFLRRIKK